MLSHLFSEAPPWLAQKAVQPENVKEHCNRIREQGRTIATLNGSFDLLHAGHLFIIYQASLQADVLFVALNSDQSVQRYKRKSRPIISLTHRLEIIAAVEFVNYVTWFDETDPCLLLERIRPNIHVNGEEYRECCIEKETVYKWGGRLHFVPRRESLATSAIIEKIKRCD
jgi:D-glycero-beta-D-manno-heptose 1-phosphate adenylyltransferase